MPKPPPWQVITEWVNEAGKESVRIVGFASYEDALVEVQRLATRVGCQEGDFALKSVELAGNYKAVWDRLKQ